MIVIVGGGISGLALAHHLQERGVEHVVLEATERVGGVIRSARVEGHLLEWGPQRARMSRDMAVLIDRLGLHDRVIRAPADLPLFVYRDGRLRRVPFSARHFITTDLLSLRGKLRALAEPLTARARDEESVGVALRRKLGREAYESLAGPLYGGLYASDPDDMIVGLSLRHALRDLDVGRSILRRLGRRRAPASPAVSFQDGLEELPRAMRLRSGARVRMGTAARAVARRGAGAGYVVETDDGPIEASHVVISAPAHAAADLMRPLAPSIAGRLASLEYNPLGIVHLHADASLRGMGYQVAFGEDMVTRGVTFNDSLFGRRGVYTAFLGGARNAWVAEADHARLAEIASTEFGRVTGIEARVLSVGHAWMPAWNRSWQAIEGIELPVGIHLHNNWAARPGLPGRLAAARLLGARLAAES